MVFVALALASTLTAPLQPQEFKRPTNAIVLFDGADTSEWVMRDGKKPFAWTVVDGAMVVKAGQSDIMTKREFGDYRLHLEFYIPLEASKKDQARSNSGVYNQGRYEIQILDSYKNPTYKFGGVGSLYSQKDPDADAVKPPENWNIYDILLTSARLAPDGKLIAKPRISVWHNGIRIHRDVEINTPMTAAGMEGKWVTKGPILLQNHGSPVRFRNIWLVPM
ncbi:MAG TPA: DUF1080 domain-containing protein [Fimbriimonas sp.]|nr:DUF1080 domain-containing protein [Fimbriimonas sp.]